MISYLCQCSVSFVVMVMWMGKNLWDRSYIPAGTVSEGCLIFELTPLSLEIS